MKFTGVVKKNLGRGAKLGFPTANIDAPKETSDGIYAAITHCNTVPYYSVVFIGAAETFNEPDRKAEVYLLDFSANIYGKEIEVEIIKKIRDNQKFDSEQELVEQMKKDEQVARDFFKDYNYVN